MAQTNTYIQSYCSIKNNEIIVNGNLFFKSEPTDFSDFSKQAFRHLDIQYPKFFKMDGLSKLAFLGAEILIPTEKNSETENNTALVLSNRSSSLDTDLKYQKTITDKEAYFPSPAVFVYTLPNICLGEISIRHQLKSENSFFIFDTFNTEFVSKYADILLQTNKATHVFCGWVDYLNEDYEAFFCLLNTEPNDNFKNETVETLYKK